MSLRSIFKGAMLVTASAALIAVITIAGILALAFYYSDGGRSWSVSVTRVSDALTYDGTEYDFSGDALLGDDRWAILIGEDGQVVWSLRKPSDVPEQYALTDVASFTRWYLGDYPVQCRIRDDGLLVVGSPKGSVWKHDISMQSRLLHDAPLWIGGIFLLALGCVLLLAYFAVRRWFRQAQRVRDAARSDWINGVSHDIRTPLSMVMGYAAQMEGAEDLPPERRRQAGIIRAQSQEIRDLVNDLNLTMRLDCAMQALRKEPLQVEAFRLSQRRHGGGLRLRDGSAVGASAPNRGRPLPAPPGGEQPAYQLCSAQRAGRLHPPGGQGRGQRSRPVRGGRRGGDCSGSG